MFSEMPESASDDELFFPQYMPSAVPGGHLQGLSGYLDPRFNSLSSGDGYSIRSAVYGNKSPESSVEDGTDLQQHDNLTDTATEQPYTKGRCLRQGSIVDGLLHEIYDRWHYSRNDSIDSDTLTECSSTSEIFFHSRQEPGGYHSAVEKRHGGQLNKTFLQNQNLSHLQRMLSDLQRSIAVMNVRLVKQLKRRDRRQAKLQRNFDIITAVLQAASLKRQIDTRMKFSIQPPPGESAFDQWRDAMKAVCRLPMGMPPEFRKKVWLSLADHYLFQLKINWEQTIRFTFNERSNPDDEQLGMQIVKDLHRTGCSNFSGDDNDEDRAVLKRLLLAYARWNKRVGYCQGFNVIAALLLNVMDRKEDDALKVMIYLIDSVLPESYFANNLRALSVDMAVFRDILKLTYPKLAKHLDRLQLAAQDVRTGACYEPPLTNVFTMQWFLTLFATCLPVNVVLRVWDSILLEGSEVLLRTALTIWGKLAKRIMGAASADEFYSLMGELSSSVMQGYVFDGDTMVKSIYAVGDFPLPHLIELREKYTYNIRPISQPSAGSKKNGKRSVFKSILNSDEDDLDDDDIAAMACLPGNVGSSDISVLGPGVYGSDVDEAPAKGAPEMERMTTDIQSLKLQYERLRQRQRQAHIIIAAASAKKMKRSSSHGLGAPDVRVAALVPSIESPVAVNHLFLGKASTSTRNRVVTDGPRISGPSSHGANSSLLTKQLQAVASAHAVSKSKRMKTSVTSKSASAAVLSKTAHISTTSTVAANSPNPATSACPCKASLVSDPLEGGVTSRQAVSSLKSSAMESLATEPAMILPGSESSDTELTSSHTQAQQESARNDFTEKALTSDLPAPDMQSEDSISPNKGNTREPEQISVCEESVASTWKSSPQNTLNECFLQDPSTHPQVLECESADSKTSGVCDSDTLEGDNQDILQCQIKHSTHCSIETMNAKNISLDRSSHLSSEISPKSLKSLITSKSVLEDSGFESLFDVSPTVLQDKQLCREDIAVVDGVEVHLGEVVHLLEEAQSTDLQQNIPQNEVTCNSDSDLNPTAPVANCVDTVHTEHTTDASGESSSGLCGEPDNLQSEALIAEKVELDEASEPSRRLSASENNNLIEESSLLNAVATSAPHPEFLVRSSSLIETVPIPATLNVRKSHIDQSSMGTPKNQEIIPSQAEEWNQDKGVAVRPSFNLERQHSVVVSHKSSSQSKKSRRFSSPAGPDMTNSPTLGHQPSAQATNRPFNPFPVRHFNANRAKTGLKLGLYSESTLEKLMILKPRTSSS